MQSHFYNVLCVSHHTFINNYGTKHAKRRTGLHYSVEFGPSCHSS
ncbi:hypothetical protein HMPREF1548_05101 [Clostridium sp. KLE 1755]|nr:hypothetical protein HMPREF1548_05101 [Clostridium sp. KLE 1755]